MDVVVIVLAVVLTDILLEVLLAAVVFSACSSSNNRRGSSSSISIFIEGLLCFFVPSQWVHFIGRPIIFTQYHPTVLIEGDMLYVLRGIGGQYGLSSTFQLTVTGSVTHCMMKHIRKILWAHGRAHPILFPLYIHIFRIYIFFSKSVLIGFNILGKIILASALIFNFKNNSCQRVDLFAFIC